MGHKQAAQVETGKVVNKVTNEQFTVSTSTGEVWKREVVEVKRTPAPMKKETNSK